MVISWAKILVFVVGGATAAAGTAYYTGMLDSYFGERVSVVAQVPDGDNDAPAEGTATSPQQDDDVQPEDAALHGGDDDVASGQDDTAAVEDEPAVESSDEDGERTAREDGDVIVPAFELLRVQPDGGMVVAGRAAPGADVEIQEGDSVLAVTKAGAGGDFAAVLDEPLGPGDYQLVLRATDEDDVVATSTQTALVSIPETRQGEVLALVDEPGEPARLITVPSIDDDGSAFVSAEGETVERAEQEIAREQPEDEQDEADGSASSGGEDVAELEAEANGGDAGTEEAAAGTEEAAGQEDEAADPDTDTAIAETRGDAPDAGDTAEIPGDIETDMAVAQGDDAPVMEDEPRRDFGGESDSDAAPGSGDDGEQGPAAEAGDGAVMVEAVEIEGDMIFVAGRATPGRTVRVYANSDLLGDAVVASNSAFLVDVRRDVPVGDYIIRADLLDAEGGVIARAAVPFVREEGESIAAVAPRLREGREQEQRGSEDDRAGDEGETVEDDTMPGGRPDREETAEQETGEDEQSVDAAPVEPAPAADAGEVEESESGAGLVAARPNAVETAPETETDQAAIVETDVTAEPLERVDGSVIIRRGDTLWHISRRVYGRGIRYSTIYLANQDQIRNPDLIWPGQIFAVPGETEEGEAADLGTLDDQAIIGAPAESAAD